MKKRWVKRLLLASLAATILLTIAAVQPSRGYCIPWLCNGWDYCEYVFCPQFGQSCASSELIESICLYGTHCYSYFLVQCQYGQSTYWECYEPGCNGR